MATTLQSLPNNVGERGGDLATRRIAFLVMAGITVLAFPPLGVSASTLKICALVAAMSGTLFLMAGLAFLQKTHYAGVTLIPDPLIMSGLVGWGYPWLAVAFGFLVLGVMGQNLVTRRCGVNKMLGVDSCDEETASS